MTNRTRASIGVVLLLRRNARFRRFSLGLLISRIGDIFNGLALSWLTLTVAGPRELGLVLLCTGLPRVPVSPFAGQLLDRFDPRILLIVDNVGRCLTVGLIPLLLTFDSLQVWHLYVIAAVAGILSTLTDVGENVIAPKIVEDADLESASAVMSATWSVSSLAGPASAGLLIGAVGLRAGFVVDALSFMAMAAAMVTLPRMSNPGAGQEVRGVARGLVVGFRQLVRLPTVGILTVISIGYLILSGVAEVNYPTYTKLDMHSTSTVFGLMMTAAGLGALFGVLVLTPLVARLSPSNALALVIAAQGIAFLPLLLVHQVWVAIVASSIVYFVAGPFYPLERTLVQRAIPAEQRGRVFGVRRALTSGGFPVGTGLGGVLVAVTGPSTLFGILSVALLLLAAVVWLTPSLRRTREPAPAESVSARSPAEPAKDGPAAALDPVELN